MSKQNTSWMLTEFIAFDVMKKSLTLSIYAVFLGKSIVKSNLMQILKICYIFLLKKNPKKAAATKKEKKTLLHIFNLSSSSGIFPESLKIGKSHTNI